MKKNEIYDTVITDFDHSARGIARVDGMVVFVPGAAVGDRCSVRILKVLSSSAFGRIESIAEPSPDRQKPDCPAFPACGGCDFRHISYSAECDFKKSFVASALERIGGLDLPDFELIPSPSINGARGKAVFPFSGGSFGFYREGSHDIVPSPGCISCRPEAYRAASLLSGFMKEHSIPAYDEASGKGCVRFLFTRSASDGSMMAMPVLNGSGGFPAELFAEKLMRELPQTVSVYTNINSGRGNAVLGKDCRLVRGLPYLEENLCDVRLRLSPLSFCQVNHDACELLYGRVLDYALSCGLRDKTLLDLYCGVGSITLHLARHCKKAVGIEIVPDAVENAKENAALNGIDNAEFFCSDAGNAGRILSDSGIHPDIVTVDPPRKGLGPELVSFISGLGCENLIYVSCDPGTLARDLAQLPGYRLSALTCFDMFPRTRHVECVVLITRNM